MFVGWTPGLLEEKGHLWGQKDALIPLWLGNDLKEDPMLSNSPQWSHLCVRVAPGNLHSKVEKQYQKHDVLLFLLFTYISLNLNSLQLFFFLPTSALPVQISVQTKKCIFSIENISNYSIKDT